MSGMGTHEETAKRKDHPWVLIVIAACAGLDVWTAWVTIGSLSGFSKLLGVFPTDWTLAPIVELYWGYALLSWLGAAPGPRSRRFAMWSAAGVFLLSLTGQGAAHLVRPGVPLNPFLIVFVTNLPVIVLALIAVLMHLRHTDREEATAAARRKAEAKRQAEAERAEADERTALRRQLDGERRAHAAELTEIRDAAQAAIEAAQAERETALRQANETAQAAAAEWQAEASRELDELTGKVSAFEETGAAAAEALAKAELRADRAERLARKAGANSGANGSRNAGAADAAKSRTTVPNDVDARAQALMILAEDPNITGRELGERCGRGERWGQLRKSELAGHVADGTGAGSGPQDSRD
jgi:hypothetical protein